jgi:hypothetical protein
VPDRKDLDRGVVEPIVEVVPDAFDNDATHAGEFDVTCERTDRRLSAKQRNRAFHVVEDGVWGGRPMQRPPLIGVAELPLSGRRKLVGAHECLATLAELG